MADMQYPAGTFQGGLEVMGHHHHRHALLAVEVGQKLIKVLGGGRVQTGDRLVQDQKAPGGAQRPGQQCPLLLAAGEIPVALVLELQDAELSHIHQGLGLLGGGVEKPEALAVEAPGQDHLIHRGRKVPLGLRLLGQVSDGALLQLRRAEDLARLGRQQSQQPPQQRGFARAVVSHDAKVVSGPDGEIQMG